MTNQKLVDNARAEIEGEKLLVENQLLHEETGEIRISESYEYFKKNHMDDLSLYRQGKSTGYSFIVLYKGVVRVASADFMTDAGQKMKEEILKVAEDWPVYNEHKLKVTVLKKLFSDPWDRRTTAEFKPTAEKTWSIIRESLLS